MGEFWNRDAQIDAVGLRDDNWTDLGECKWGRVRSPTALVAELEAKSRHFPNERGATLALRCFTRVAPRGTLPAGVRWHCLSDLYDAP